MAKREYIGDPIDATMQYIKERNSKGETVAGTSADDAGDETTDAIPTFVDREAYTDQQLDIVEKKILYPDLGLKELCEKFGFPKASTSTFLAKFRRDDYSEELKRAGIYDKLRFPNSPTDAPIREPPDDEDTRVDERARVQEYWRENPEADVGEVRDATGVETLSDNAIIGCKSVISLEPPEEAGNSDGEEDGEGVPVPLSPQTLSRLREEATDAGFIVGSPDEQIPVVLDRLDGLKEEVAELRERESGDDAGVAELDTDTLFTIVTGGELSEEKRREVFELISGGDDG